VCEAAGHAVEADTDHAGDTRAFPQSTVEELVLAQKPNDTVKIIVLQSNGPDVGILVNPYTGEIVGRSDPLFRPMLAIREFHTHLLIWRRSGHVIMTIAACFLFGLAVTGLVLLLQHSLSQDPGFGGIKTRTAVASGELAE
jgi:uncharacterized iron-regulated membrane protein